LVEVLKGVFGREVITLNIIRSENGQMLVLAKLF
jgi:hypothetical protein